MSQPYDQLGRGYTVQRTPDPRIRALVLRELDGMASVLNVGAGAGAYEPEDLPVLAVEPSLRMISQRGNRSNVVQAMAESLPFGDGAIDAAMAVLTIHHWQDRRKGLRECARVARRRIVILTWDPESDGFWLVREYFPEMLALDRGIFPTMGELRQMLGPIVVRPVPIPADCTDGFLGAYWRRPQAYLNADVRSGMSSFARIEDVEPRIQDLKKELASGAWERRHVDLLQAEALDVGYTLLTAGSH